VVPSTWHLTVLGQAFPRYWDELRKSEDRPLFEVQRAQIRWYTEHLMRASPPREEDKRKRRAQWKGLWDHAAASLATQFPFLDPNIVQKGQADHLALCYRNIEAPLVPVFGYLLSETQFEQVRQRWHDLRYARVDLWQQLGGRTTGPEKPTEPPGQAGLDYRLTQKSLTQFQAHIAAIVTTVSPCGIGSRLREGVSMRGHKPEEKSAV